uniref:VWFA domain-containing protein n=1 Tax=Anopheles coluzzii TaxID=1518534 RepID=A0A8W7PVA6_ANOCL
MAHTHLKLRPHERTGSRFSRDQLDQWGLVRVSEKFRVIALGLPVPRYRGSPLDPPLRSRFQARDIAELPYVEVLTEAKALAGPLDHPDVLTKLVSFAYGIQSASALLPDFPIDNLQYAGRLLRHNGTLTEQELLRRFYPYPVFLEKEGSSYAVAVPFVSENNPPKDAKRRLETIKMMHAHAQFCWSGDHTLAATELAVDELAKEDCDEAIVIVLSDANLARYGITPRKLNAALARQSPRVQAYVIFIGSLDDEAKVVADSMTAGKAFVCMDLEQLPHIMRQIFAASLLQ